MAKQALEVLSPTEVSDLDSLAKQIDAAHVEVGRVLLTSVQLAAEAGHLLAQAKGQVPHGQWETWVSENTAVSARSARSYMQIEKLWAHADKAKRRRVADLGQRAWLAEMAEPRRTPAVEPEDTTAAPAEPKTFSGRVVRVPAEDSERTGGSDQSRIAATMKIVREAEYTSGASRRITGDPIPSAANLVGINREWNKLGTADRDKFLSEKLRTHGHPDHHDMDIVDMPT